MKIFNCISVFLIITSFAYGQNRIVTAKGKIIEKSVDIDPFTELVVDLDCDVHLQLGTMNMASVEANRNLVDKVDFIQDGKRLILKVKEGCWIEKAKPQIYLQTPFINKLITYGHQTGIGKIVVNNIDVKLFEADILYGEILLTGEVRTLKLRSSNRNYYGDNSNLDATRLKASVVDAKILGSNSATVNAIDELNAHLKYDAQLSYVGEPKNLNLSGKAVVISAGVLGVNDDYQQASDTKTQKSESLKYVKVKVKNNSAIRKHFIIKGPNENGKTFSYGFPLMPLAVREKNVPVGTKIYLQKGGVFNKKLITIGADDDGKVLKLF